LEIPSGENSEALPTDLDSREGFLETSSLQEEYDRRWILNLSMQFRDKSNREKFFVTYAERPNKWRRVTISLDYRNAPEDSLEADLGALVYQRDKSMRVYEAIRESLPDIQYYNTVTNLKLETTPEDGQLHVHVREDANETIEFPAISLFDHIRQPRFNESSILLESHLSGFVYKVRLGHRVLIKKEIPGPDTVDEFLYEVNALDSLIGCDHVVQLEGLVTDDRGEVVKGLLLSYASQGAMVDMIFDFRGTASLPWHRREKWAKQIVSGLADIHESGFVQGDFTLSNIVIDEDDNALIIDINRRGCPVGWEPPELSRFIDSGQRISMCIGVKTDLYQLGMVLWALAEEVDEPERVERPLPPVFDGIPPYYRDIVQTCLRERPQGRASAKELLRQFPPSAGSPPGRASVEFSSHLQTSEHPTSSSKSHRSDKEYIDPDMAVTIDDVKNDQHRRHESPYRIESDQVTYLDPSSNPASTTYPPEGSDSWIAGRRSRGRSPVSIPRRRSSPYGRSVSSATSVSEGEEQPRGRLTRGSEEIEEDKRSVDSADDIPPCRRPPLASPPADSRGPGLEQFALPAEFAHTDSGFDEVMEQRVESRQAECQPSNTVEGDESTPVPSARCSAVTHLPCRPTEMTRPHHELETHEQRDDIHDFTNDE
jgi:serine/threonine protein kinase